MRNVLIPLREGPNETEDDKCTAASAHHSPAHVGNCFLIRPAPHVHGQLHTDGLQQDKVAEEGKIIVETGNYRTDREATLSRAHDLILGQNLVCRKKHGWVCALQIYRLAFHFLKLLIHDVEATCLNHWQLGELSKKLSRFCFWVDNLVQLLLWIGSDNWLRKVYLRYPSDKLFRSSGVRVLLQCKLLSLLSFRKYVTSNSWFWYLRLSFRCDGISQHLPRPVSWSVLL